MAYTDDVDVLPNEGWDERIILCRNGTLVTTAIVVTTRFVVVVDTMMNPATALQLLAEAKRHRTHGRELLVVNTHADFDHAWGNQVFAGTDILGTRACIDIFARDDVAAALRTYQAGHPAHFSDVDLTPPTTTVSDGQVIDGGDLSLQIVATPGHTRDHISVYIPEIDTLLAGDAAELPFPMSCEGVTGLADMRASLDRLARIDAHTTLYCHAPVHAGTDLLHENMSYFHALEARCRDAMSHGVAPETSNLTDAVGCRVDSVVPEAAEWRLNVEATEAQHEQQLRMMLQWVSERHAE